MFPIPHSALLIVLLALILLAAPSISALETPPDAARIQVIEAMLPEKPAAPGPALSDRATWDALATQPAYQEVLKRAETMLAQPLPAQSDELYLEFSRNGNRTRWQQVSASRRSRLAPLVVAECLENKGRFVPAIEELIAAVCAERTWVMPAHDAKLDNFNGKRIEIDLASSALGWNLAVADFVLGQRLATTTRTQLRENVARRVLEPFRAMYSGKQKPDWWMLTTNNWNSVCLAGVTGAALAQIESRRERAEFVAAAEKYIGNFLAGFTPDGYCSEGLGYWNYGFGHFVLLSETIRRATNDGLDLLSLPTAQMPAKFGARIQIIGGVAPAFADCGVTAKPMPSVMYLLNRRLQLGLREYDQLDSRHTFGTLFEALIYNFADTGRKLSTPASSSPTGATAAGLRDWFDHAGILISRPAPGSATHMGVALKGGHNAEHHNHNDLGSFVVVLGDRPVLLDPGNETYTARTFSNRRYDSKLLNSFGHPVPVVSKTLQQEGRKAEARVLQSNFSDTTDTLQLDLTSAYPVPDLTGVHRTFVYSRQGNGSLVVRDNVEFKKPQPFGTALLTLGSWQRQADGSLLVFDVEEAVRVEIDAGGREFSIDAETIEEDAPVKPTRLGINLKEPVTQAQITLKITPWQTEGKDGELLRNGDFEAGSFGWELPKTGMGALSNEQAAGGKTSLKISDRDKTAGSNVSSARIPAAPEKRYTLKGQSRHILGSGVGLYVRYLNAQREVINPTTGGNNIAPAGVTAVAKDQWQPFAFDFQTPPQTAFIQLWIHSFNGSESEVYLDNLAIVPAG